MTPLLLALIVVASDPDPRDVAAYQTASAKAGHDPEAHVKLALWAESKGMADRRDAELAEAIRIVPDHSRARALLGWVREDGHWQKPEDVKLAPAREAQLVAYDDRRAQSGKTLADQLKLADWCAIHGLKAEARAHLMAAGRLDPARVDVWTKLGYRQREGHWVDPAHDAQARQVHADATLAHQKWTARLTQLAHQLGQPAHRAEAQTELSTLRDPMAAPSIWAIFAAGIGRHHDLAARLLGQVEAPESSSRLALLAMFDEDEPVRSAAIDALTRRDAREFVGPVISYLQAPLKIDTRAVGGPDGVGSLMVENQLVREYPIPTRDEYRAGVYNPMPVLDQGRYVFPHRQYGSAYQYSVQYNPPDPAVAQAFQQAATKPGEAGAIFRGLASSPHSAPAPVMVNVRVPTGPRLVGGYVTAPRPSAAAVRQAAKDFERAYDGYVRSVEQQLKDDTLVFEEQNRLIREVAARAVKILEKTTERPYGVDQEGWARWWLAWNESEGTGRLAPPNPAGSVPMVAADKPGHSRIAAGTLVRTDRGLKAMESLRIGDRVLSQDPRTAVLLFEPVIGVADAVPGETRKVAMEGGGSPIVLTLMERVWVAGRGWTAARDLKPGDPVRLLGGRGRIASVEPGGEAPGYNVVLADASTLFAGDRGVLIHDNAIVHPPARPFDAVIDP